jgi:solute:Na+ symporter, SSS family
MPDLIIVIIYFLAMLFMGWRSRRQSAESYWVAARSYGTVRITMSLVATIFGASSTMGIIGLGYSRGLTGAWWALVGGFALIPFALFLSTRVRALNVYTLPDILRHAYGQKVAVPAGVMIAVAWCGVVAAQLIAGGRLVSGIFSLDFGMSLACVAVVFTLYTFWGGQLSVIRTDTWQLTLFVGGLVAALAFLLAASPWEGIPAGHWGFPVSEKFGWYQVLVFYPLIVGLPYLVGPDIYSRVLCARDGKVARRAALQAAMVVIPLSFLLAFVGILAKGQFPGIPAEAALPETLGRLVPMGLKGLIVAGFLGAIMSSADTCLLSASTILTLNVIGPLSGTAEKNHYAITRGMVLVLGVAAWFIAGQLKGIISSLLLGYTVFVGGVVCPTLAAFFRDRLKIGANAALWAVIIGGGTAILGKIQGGAVMKALLTRHGQGALETLLGPGYLNILPILLSALILIVASRLWSSSKEKREKRKEERV